MQVHNFTHDREAEAGALAFVPLREAFKDVVLSDLWNWGAVICDIDVHSRFKCFALNGYGR